MLTDIGDSLPAIIATAIAMIGMSGLTLFVAKKSGVSDIQAVASRESDRLVKAQEGQIKILKEDAKRDRAHIVRLEEKLERAFTRIDLLEKLITDDQLRKLDRGR
jgi:hypothetical protein